MRNISSSILLVLSIILLAGCGGGGGGGVAVPPLTKAETKVLLFGTMSPSSKIATIHSEITVPEGIMVNYSSPPGATIGKFPLRTGSIIPSGTVQIAANDLTAEYDLTARKLFVDYINSPDFSTGSRKNIISGTVTDGVEIATIKFTLSKAGVKPILPNPWEDMTASIYEETVTHDVIPLTGLKLNFLTTFSY